MATQLLTPREVAKRLSVSPRTVYNWLEEGRLPSVHLSERVTRIPEDAVESLIARETQAATVGDLAPGNLIAADAAAAYGTSAQALCARCSAPLAAFPRGTVENPTQLRRDLLHAHKDEILAIADRRRATNIRVFGSVARGDARKDSDIDLLVDLLPNASLFDLGGLNQELEDLLGVRVDVVPARSIKEQISQRVFEEAIPL